MNRTVQFALLGLLGFAMLLAVKQISAAWLAHDYPRCSEVAELEQSQSRMIRRSVEQMHGLRCAVGIERTGWIWSAASSEHLARLAEAERHNAWIDAGEIFGATQRTGLDLGKYIPRLVDALAASPRATSLRVRVGLAAEQDGQLKLAESVLLQAGRFDRQYFPAWSLANFYFRQGSEDQFWNWAGRASLRIYDDHRPLLRLADALETNPGILLSRLNAQPPMERAYLDYLIGEGRLADADEAARYLVGNRRFNEIDGTDRARIADLVDRHLDAQQIPAALDLWTLLGTTREMADGATLENTTFDHAPSGTGLDWRLDFCPEARADLQSGQLRIRFFQVRESTAGKACSVLRRRMILKAGMRYRLRSTISGLADSHDEITYPPGLHWTLGPTDGLPEADRDSEHIWTFDRIPEPPGSDAQGNVAVWLVLSYRSPAHPPQLPPTLILRSAQLEAL